MADFSLPNLAAPLDETAALATVPDGATVRGMFLQDVVDDLKSSGHSVADFKTSYIAFKSYPLIDYVRMNLYAAKVLFPTQPLRAGIINMGKKIYPRFTKSLIGKSIFAIAGNRFDQVVKLAAKAYSVGLSESEVRVLDVGESHAHVELKKIYALVDTLQVGNWVGAMDAVGVTGELLVKLISPTHAEFKLTWQNKR